ncbi:hypothetical protein GJ688_17380 [Heliobacillus mobilis]|uniref:Uncharacterized protein n=1 Tax=Heliobacterium mobile TaxID=28064 RepID=A0A6I3SP89_HELMO|nr:hypothetical protein [Heliobacterium mobile]MTV50709.1 hypothetical protein [Heliobacterium mobile]
MEEWALQAGERPYRILTAVNEGSPENLKKMDFYSKIKENGLIDCLLIFDYGDRKAIRQARDFPPDQFEHFLQGLESRCPLPTQIVDGTVEEERAVSIWESFIGVRTDIAAS